jgi:broad specificity phosphatase PhoE
MITFYLVRHGEAENNVRHILNSLPEKSEYPLTDRGRQQVAVTADFLGTVGADVIWSSPILRARETAGIISQTTGLTVNIDDRLCEVHFGVFNGHQQEEFLKKYPEAEMRLSPDPADGVESYLDIRARLTMFLSDMEEKHTGKKVIIVSHGDTLEQLHGILTDEAPGRSATGWYPEKGSCTEVVWKQ